MNISFEGKRALVTGAGSGIGKEIALRLLQCRAKVIAVDVSSNLLKILKEEEPSMETLRIDLANWSETNEAVKNTGPIDLLVNNAGVIFEAPIIQITEEQVIKQLDINIKAVINMTQAVATGMISRKAPGAIVNISSQASQAGISNQSVYCASKGAVDAFTRAAALELGPHGIRVNSVNPTIIMTDLGRKCWSDTKKAAPMLAKIPLGRFGEAHEVADAVAYLLSDRASLINGSCVPVDGGFLAN